MKNYLTDVYALSAAGKEDEANKMLAAAFQELAKDVNNLLVAWDGNLPIVLAGLGITMEVVVTHLPENEVQFGEWLAKGLGAQYMFMTEDA